MKSFERDTLDVERLRREVRDGKAAKYMRVLFDPKVLLNWIDDGVPSMRIIEVRVDYEGLILELDPEPIEPPWMERIP